MIRNTHRVGDYLMVCDECGITYYASEIVKRWDGAMVCRQDWEPRHPQDFVRAKADPYPLTDVRPKEAEAPVANTIPLNVGQTAIPTTLTGPAAHLFDVAEE